MPPAGDAVDANPLKDDFIGEIAGDGAGGNAEEGNAATVFYGTKGMVQGRGVSGHFQRRIDAFSPRDVENRCGNGLRAVALGVEYVIDAHLFGQAQAVITDVGGDNGSGSCGAGDGCGEQAGRAAAGD